MPSTTDPFPDLFDQLNFLDLEGARHLQLVGQPEEERACVRGQLLVQAGGQLPQVHGPLGVHDGRHAGATIRALDLQQTPSRGQSHPMLLHSAQLTLSRTVALRHQHSLQIYIERSAHLGSSFGVALALQFFKVAFSTF